MTEAGEGDACQVRTKNGFHAQGLGDRTTHESDYHHHRETSLNS
jgi:hypothetical protein